MAINPALRQVSNRNFLSPVGFKLKINKCPKVDFLATQANLPGITLGTAVQANPYKDLESKAKNLLEGMKEMFDNKSIEYTHRKVPGFPLEQLFVDDPDGVKVELNFPTKG